MAKRKPTKAELEDLGYWKLKNEYPNCYKVGMSKPKLVKAVLEAHGTEGLVNVDTNSAIEAKMLIETGAEICYKLDAGKFIKEMYDSLKDKGILKISVPLAPHESAFTDPLAINSFTRDSFSYFDKRNDNWKNIGKERGYAGFSFVRQSIIGQTLNVELVK